VPRFGKPLKVKKKKKQKPYTPPKKLKKKKKNKKKKPKRVFPKHFQICSLFSF